jgi:tetratricopeptide (TPR) repeat protein
MRSGHAAFDNLGWGDSPVLLAFPIDQVERTSEEGPPAQALLAHDTDAFIDDDVTPSVDSFRELERAYFSEERWSDLVNLFVERAASVGDPEERTRCLVRAAQLFDTNLGDSDRAFVTLLAALHEDPDNDGVAAELARLATVHNRWDELISNCNDLLATAGSEIRKAELLVAMALWHERDLGDRPAAERYLEAALSADPTNAAALRPLVLLHGQRGDWVRAAAYLTCAAHKALDPVDGLEFALEAAEIYRDQLHDTESAVVQYMRVLQLSPEHPKAVAALAELAWERQDWTVAVPLLEGMAGTANTAMEESAQLWQKAAWSAQMAGDVERARQNYRKAYTMLPTHLPTLQAWSRLAVERGWWQDIITTVPRLLASCGAEMPGEERASHLLALGNAHVATRDLEAGVAAFMQALRVAPDLPGARRALARATEQMEGRGSANALALLEQYRTLLRGQLSTEERFDIVCKIGRLQREELGDMPAALGTYLQAAELRPHDVAVLHELVEIHTQNRHWSRAADVLERLVTLTTGREKVCYLVALASILNSELDAPGEAVAIYDRALDEDPSDRRTFERIEHILVERQQWRELCRAYRRMIKRLGPKPSADQRPYLRVLWRALADTYRRYLRDLPAATAAYEVCVSLAPDDARPRVALAEVYEAQGREGFAKAVAAREHLLKQARGADAAAEQIRALAKLYGKYEQYDQVFCASAALCALTKANARERAFYEVNGPRGVAVARTVLTERQWQGRLCSSLSNQMIAQVLAAAAPALITARAKEPSVYGLERQHRAKIVGDPTFVSRLLVYASRVLGVPLPAIYVPPQTTGEVELAVLLDAGRPAPALVLGHDLVVGRTQPELAFLLTKKLVGLRADHFLLWPQIVPSRSELQVILAAAIRLVQPKFEIPDTDGAAVRKYVSFFHKALPQAQIERIAGAAAPLLAHPGRIDIRAWLADADAIANRAGLLVCGDMVAAARELVREARALHARPEEAILALVRWGMSSDCLELRSRLGLALLAANPKAPPVAHSFAELGGLFDRGLVRS